MRRSLIITSIGMIALLLSLSLVLTGFNLPFIHSQNQTSSISKNYSLFSRLPYNSTILSPIVIGNKVYFDLYIQNMTSPNLWPVETYLASLDLNSGKITKHVNLWKGNYGEFMDTGIGHLYKYDGRYIYFVKVNKSGDRYFRVFGVFDPTTESVVNSNVTKLALKVMEGENGEFRPPTADELGYRYWWLPINGYLFVLGLMHYSLDNGTYERRMGLVNVSTGELVWVYDFANTGVNSSFLLIRQLYPIQRVFTITTGELGYEWYAHAHPHHGLFLLEVGTLGFVSVGMDKIVVNGQRDYQVNFHYTIVNASRVEVLHTKAPAPIYREYMSGGWNIRVFYTRTGIYALINARFYNNTLILRETKLYKLDWIGNVIWHIKLLGDNEEPIMAFQDDLETITPIHVSKNGSTLNLALIKRVYDANNTNMMEPITVMKINDDNGIVINKTEYDRYDVVSSRIEKIRFYSDHLTALVTHEKQVEGSPIPLKEEKLVIIYYNLTVVEITIRDLIYNLSKEIWGSKTKDFYVLPMNTFSHNGSIYLIARTSYRLEAYTVIIKFF